jgi:hypothetical protein
VQVPPLAVERVTVAERTLEALVRVTDPTLMRTSAVPGLAEEALRLLPGLARHRCDCRSAHGFVAELADTETPHLLEHVALELAVLAGSPRTLAGRTTWDFERDGRGVFRVGLEFDDERVALDAVCGGVRVVAALLGRAAMPDIPEEVARLRGMRR